MSDFIEVFKIIALITIVVINVMNIIKSKFLNFAFQNKEKITINVLFLN